VADTDKTSTMLVDELAAALRTVSETFTEVPDGQKTGFVLGVLAGLLDPA
jgi:hypothetical protein